MEAWEHEILVWKDGKVAVVRGNDVDRLSETFTEALARYGREGWTVCAGIGGGWKGGTEYVLRRPLQGP